MGARVGGNCALSKALPPPNAAKMRENRGRDLAVMLLMEILTTALTARPL